MEESQSTVELPQASRVLRQYRDWLHSIPGCNRTGIGKLPSGDYYIEVGFRTWETLNDAIAHSKVPSVLDGVRVVVDDKPGIAKLADDMERYRPARGGCSISHSNDTLSAGTLGAWVRDKVTGKMCVISCEHVLDVANNPGAWVIQPAIRDGGIASDHRIAVNLRGYRDVYHDCAIAEVISDAQISSYGLAYTGVMAANCIVLDPSVPVDMWYGMGGGFAYVGERVVKRGRTTEFTTGYVDHLESRVDFDPPPFGLGGRLEDAIRVRNLGGVEFSRPGDSGSLLLQQSSNCVRGLITAIVLEPKQDPDDPDVTRYTFAQKWDRVVRKLDLDTGRYHVRTEWIDF